MAKYAHADVLDGGLNAIKNSAIRMLLLKAYTAGDSYATVTGNAICTIAMVSGDYTLSGADNAPRVLTSGGQERDSLRQFGRIAKPAHRLHR